MQIGITLIGLLTGIYSGENITNDVQAQLEKIDALRPYANDLAVAIVVVIITYFTLILGELAPKRIGLAYPEAIASTVAYPMRIISKIVSPFVWLLNKSNDIVMRVLNIKSVSEAKVTEEEIRAIVSQSAEGGEIEKIEQNIVERVFTLGDRKVSELMTHRADLAWLDIKDDFATIRKKIAKEIHSIYPVTEGRMDNFVGIVSMKEILVKVSIEEEFSLAEYIRQPLYIPEKMPAYKLLETFREQRVHHAIVIDEYGLVQGIITMDDLMDALVGDVSEVYQEEYTIVQNSDNTWLVDAQLPVYEFFKYFGLEADKNATKQYTTVGGLFLSALHSLPKAGDKLPIKDLQLEIIDMDGRRIDKILATRMPTATKK